MAQVLNVQIRDTRGKRNARRQRRAGHLPAVLYGHKLETISLSVPGEELESAIRHGARLIKLTGALDEQAFVREVQWDTYGQRVLHVDLTRVSEHEKVNVVVTVELRGEAPGVKVGGVVKQGLHEMEIECEATAIPEKISVGINQLEMGQKITVADLTLPPGVTPLVEPDSIVVECAEPVEMVEEAPAEAGEGEPEVIGRKKEEEESEE